MLTPSKFGRGSLIGSVFAWHVNGPEFDHRIQYILSWRLGHENISTAILSFRWFKKSSCQLLAKECELMHQSFVNPAPPPTYGDSGANVRGNDLLSSPAVPSECRACDIT